MAAAKRMQAQKPRRKPAQPARKPLTESEMIEILEEIARTGRNQAAQIAAIRVLREIGAGQKPVADGFAELDVPSSAARAGVRLKAV